MFSGVSVYSFKKSGNNVITCIFCILENKLIHLTSKLNLDSLWKFKKGSFLVVRYFFSVVKTSSKSSTPVKYESLSKRS